MKYQLNKKSYEFSKYPWNKARKTLIVFVVDVSREMNLEEMLIWLLQPGMNPEERLIN